VFIERYPDEEGRGIKVDGESLLTLPFIRRIPLPDFHSSILRPQFPTLDGLDLSSLSTRNHSDKVSTMKLAYLLLAPALALTAAAQTIANRDFAIEGCLGLTAILDQTGAIAGSAITGLFQTESACAVSASRKQRGGETHCSERLPVERLQIRLLPRWSDPFDCDLVCLFQQVA
jgi:hypothetical protein